MQNIQNLVASLIYWVH